MKTKLAWWGYILAGVILFIASAILGSVYGDAFRILAGVLVVIGVAKLSWWACMLTGVALLIVRTILGGVYGDTFQLMATVLIIIGVIVGVRRMIHRKES